MGKTGTQLAVALIFGSAIACFGQTAPLTGSICGHVALSDTHHPIPGAKVVMAPNESKPPFSTQTTGADGGFCFNSLASGQYKILVLKAGFVLLPRTPGADLEYTEIEDGKPTPALELRMAPTLPVSPAAKAFDAMFSPEERGSPDFRFDSATFSPDGRYLAVALWLPARRSDYGDAEQILRYDLITRKLVAITPGPSTSPLPQFNQAVRSGDTLYTSGTQIYPGGLGKDAFFKTEGDVTTTIDSLPPQIAPPSLRFPLRVGPYLLNWDEGHGWRHLSLGKIVISDTVGDNDWATLDSPPSVFWGWWGTIYVFYLKTHHRQIDRVPNPELQFLAVTPIPSGFRVAYSTLGDCSVNPRTLSKSFGILPDTPERRPPNLCFVEISDESRTNDSARGSEGR